jgi:hypothetical protein
LIIGVIFKDGKEIDRGISTGGKHFSKEYPEQYIRIATETSAYVVKGERKYTHDGTITFQELQDNGNGLEVVYDSTEGVDRTKHYDIPSWFANPDLDIPNYHHRINDNGELETEFRGYLK